MRRHSVRTRWSLVALISLVSLALVSIGAKSADAQNSDPKVYVCKYVGTPGVDERLQTGQNPIEVSVNATGGTPVGSYFADAHGRSYVLGVVPMVREPSLANCPPPVVPELGRLEVTKVVVGEGAPTGMVFEISLTPQGGNAITKSITDAGVVVFEGLKPGVYALSEKNLGSDWNVSYSSTSITVEADKTAKATVTNTYSPPVVPELGRVEVTKVVVGEGAPTGVVFEISLTPQGGNAITKSITGAGVVVFEGLEPGLYALSEKNLGSDWNVSYSSTSITVEAGETALTTVTNTYAHQVVPPEFGSVVVTKVVTGEPLATTYQIGLVGPAPAQTERWLTVVGAGQVTFAALPIGMYTVVERDPGQGYTVTIAPNTVVVTNGGVANATVTNAYVKQASSPPTVPPTTEVASAGAQPSETLPAAGQSLPKTGADGRLAILALILVAGGTALAAISRRRVS